jgi:hypothetical protein
MSRYLQGFSAVLVAVVLLMVQAAPAAAVMGEDLENRGKTNIIVDALILRPLGLVMIAGGTVFWAAGIAPLVAITRPTDLGKTMSHMIVRPVRYTFVDPLGHH